MIIKDGKLMNTEEDNRKVEEFLNRQPKIRVRNKDTGEIFFVPYIKEVEWERK